MRMILWWQRADTHECLGADLDDRHAGFVMEVRNDYVCHGLHTYTCFAATPLRGGPKRKPQPRKTAGSAALVVTISDLPSCAEVTGWRIMEGQLPSGDRLRTYMDALRNLARSDAPDRAKLVAKNVDLYLEEGARNRALEDLRSAIHNEESERREGEDWSIAAEYVHSLLQETNSEDAA